MKTLKPLAAALLLLASPAAAQLLTGPSGSGGFNFGGTGNLASQAAPITDFTFRCGTPPWKACTDVEMNQRQPILMARKCPAPATAACTDFLMRELGGGNPAEAIAAYTPPPGRQWASPTCQRIPCRLADAPGTGATESGLPYDQQPGFIGPPAPPKSDLPPAFDPGVFQQELAAARSDNPNTIVDLGDNRYGVVLEDDTVSVCGRGQCTMPRPSRDFPNLADQIQAANSLNSGAGSINNGSPNGFTKSDAKRSPPASPGNGGRTAASPPPSGDVASAASDEARTSGGDAGDFFRGSSSDSGSGMGASAGGSEGDAYASKGQGKVIAAQAAKLDGIYTYNKTQEIQAKIERTAGAVTTGADGTFATPSNTPDANAGNLEFKGTQSGSNQ